MNITIKNFTYGGMLLGLIMGWYLPIIFLKNVSYFTRIGFSILMGFTGIIIGYKLYKYLLKKK